MTARSSGIVAVHRENKTSQIIDVAIPEDGRVLIKQWEKIGKHHNLAREIHSLWKVKTHVCNMRRVLRKK